MSSQIDELLQEDQYDIYHNLNISDEAIEKMAGIFSSNPNVDFMEYFDFLKCSSKFCWINFLRIIEKMPYEEKVKGLPLLFELLQDANWPAYEKTVQLLESFDKEFITPYYRKYLRQAYEEKDEMWIDNIEWLAEKLEIDIDNSEEKKHPKRLDDQCGLMK